jgi:multiple sugar transport system substrate-binding protein
MNDHELLRILDFVDRIRKPYTELVAVDSGESDWTIVSYLIRSHLGGYPVTITKLAHVSGLPHGTAIRRIQRLVEAGLIVQQPSNRLRRRFTLHPSARLQKQVTSYARRAKETIAEMVGARQSAEDEDSYYFGGIPAGSQVIPPISLLQNRVEKGVELNFLLNSDNYFESMRNTWVDFRSNLASAKNFDLRQQQALYTLALENGRKRVSAYDVIAIDMPWLGEFAERGLIRPIGDEIRQAGINPMDFHPTIWSTTTWRGVEYGVPIYCTIEILAARSDLFAETGLAYPRTFDGVIDAGRKLQSPGHGRYGVVWNGARGMPVASSFMFFMGCCGQPVISLRKTPEGFSTDSLDGGHMRPQVNSDAGREALDYMHRLVEISPPGVLDFDWEDSCEVFLSGRASMAYVWTMRAARFEGEIRSAVKRRVEFLPQPAGPRGQNVSPIGGFLLGVPANLPEDRCRLAIEAIAWMTSREAMKVYVRNGFPIAPRFSVSADPEAAASSQIVRFVDALARRNLLRNWQRPAVPSYTRFETILGEEIHDALQGRKTDAEALKCAENRMNRILDAAAPAAAPGARTGRTARRPGSGAPAGRATAG